MTPNAAKILAALTLLLVVVIVLLIKSGIVHNANEAVLGGIVMFGVIMAIVVKWQMR